MSNISLDIWFLLRIYSKYPQNLHCFYKEAEKDVSNIFIFFLTKYLWTQGYLHDFILFGIIYCFHLLKHLMFTMFSQCNVGRFHVFHLEKNIFPYIESWKPGTELATSRHKSPHVHCQGQTTPSMSSSLELAFLPILVSCPSIYSQMPLVKVIPLLQHLLL